MTQPHQIFIFNSSLPEGRSVQDLLRCMGPSFGQIRGKNIGNTYISYGLLKALFGRAAQVDHLSNAWESPLSEELAEKINSKYTHFVIVLQDFIRESFACLPFEKVTRFLEKIRIPVVPMSLSANSFNGFDSSLADRLNLEQKRFLSVLSEKSKSIGVRGYFSAEILERLGVKNSRVTGCPSYYENGAVRVLEKKTWNPDSVVTTGTFFNKNLPRASHLLQDELYFINLLYLGDGAGFSGQNITARAFNLDEVATSFQFLAHAMAGRLEFFSDFYRWAQFFRDHDRCLTIGTRLHSGIFSINNGVPAIVTNPDARAQETCEYLKIPYAPAIHAASDIRDVYENLDLDIMNRSYPSLYKNFLDYLDEHGITPVVVSDETPCFDFPQTKKTLDARSQGEIYRAFTELSALVERERVTMQAFGGSKIKRAQDQFRKLTSKYPSLSPGEYYGYLKKALG